jgi:4-amino-4-deoxy-L-arabinose transferase-like glycosyltransferase
MGNRTFWTDRRRQTSTYFFCILAIALLLRTVWALLVPVEPVSDGVVYNLLARNLAHGLGYCWSPGNPTGYWPVGTSFLYSVLFRLFGEGFAPILVFNIAISVATIWLTMRLAQRWFGVRVALIAGGLAALWPVQIEFTTVLASELIFNLLLVLLLTVWEQERLNPWAKAVLVGLLSAAACYLRPVGMLLPAVLFALTVNRERRFLRPALLAAVALLAMAVAIAPWSIRNTRIFGRFELVSTNGGPNFWMGNNPAGPGGTEDLPAEAVNLPEGVRDAYLAAQARAYIRQYPGRFVVRSLKKVVWLHDHETIGVHWNLAALTSRFGERGVRRLKLLSDLYWWTVLLLAMAGCSLVMTRHGMWAFFTAPAVVLWAYFTALYAVMVTQDRYHFPSLPFIGILAAVTISTLWQKFGPERAA